MSLLKVVQPLFWFSKPLGVLPLTFRDGRFLVSKLSLLYSACGVACFVIGGYGRTLKNTLKLFSKPIEGSEILTFVSSSIVNIFGVLNIYYSAVCAKKLSHMFNELNVLMRSTRNLSYMESALMVRSIVIVLQIFVFFNYMFISILQTGLDYMELFKATTRILSLTSITCISTHFCALCLVLRSLIKSMNSELEQTLSSCSASNLNLQSAEKRLHVRMLRYRYVYAKIFDVCSDMNNLFGIFILLALTQYNIYIHVEVFGIISVLIDFNIKSNSEWTVEHTRSLIWAFVNVMKIMSHFVCCSLVISETKKTGTISSKYLARLPRGAALESIDCFSRAVAAMKLAFSANGFFSIDWEILFSSASACTVNTLILIQSYVNNHPDTGIVTGTE
ncbi:Hypothetical predicted protein [Cloeon dipterum]|uniref:Gustatory receptor n=1 Tax=Cloeon dipterum TaxID=197152 RepID=A0A8S1CF92_9INSE|nr:Hypothetical predicted protein [Cloeon dipterum]